MNLYFFMYMSDCNYFEGDSISVKSSTFHNNKIRNAKKLTEVTKSPVSFFIYNQARFSAKLFHL